MLLWSLACFEQPTRTGQEVYSSFCIHCHQQNGAGVAGRYPPLAGSEWLSGDTPVLIVLHGLQGEIEVKGQVYSNVMAPWGGVLNDEEVAGVVNYIRSSWGNSGEKTTAERVKQLREKHKGRRSWRAETLAKELEEVK